MAEVALTNIKHGDGEDSVFIEAGEFVSDLPSDVKEQLRASGAIGESPTAVDEKEKADLRAEIARLQGELDKASPIADPDTPGVAAEKLFNDGKLIQDPESGDLLEEDDDEDTTA